MKPAMTGAQADALAAFIVTLRPGQSRWTKATVYDALTAAAAKHTPDAEALTRSAVRAALTPSIVDPSVIAMPGAHWESVNHSPAHEPQRASRCPECGGMHMPGTDHQPRNGRASNPDAIAAMRNLIAGAKRPLPKETA